VGRKGWAENKLGRKRLGRKQKWAEKRPTLLSLLSAFRKSERELFQLDLTPNIVERKKQKYIYSTVIKVPEA